jgi:predicted enzyme related to lactoylglutathione lyase
MPLAFFKDLCLDAVDPEVMATFWADALGLARDPEDRPGLVKLVGCEPGQAVWVNRVPEPKTVKHRVHLDVHASGPDALAGATPISAPGEFRWRVMADPEGGELCVFTREVVPDYRLYEVAVDAEAPVAQAAWWAEVFGTSTQSGDDGTAWLEGVPGMPFEALVFGPVPEPKTVKNRIHWDIDVASLDAVDDLVSRGATVLRPPDDDIGWTVLADPEGNEFCVFVA